VLLVSANHSVNEVAGPGPDIIVDSTDILSEQAHSNELGANEDKKNGK